MKRVLTPAAAVLLGACAFTALAQSATEGDTSFDGLKRVAAGKVAFAWVIPGADFKRYTKIQLEDARVAFKKDWSAEHSQATVEDMNRIRGRAADLFHDVFADVLENGGYPVVDAGGPDVLLLRPSIVDLDITPPKGAGEKSGSSYTTSAGGATLSLEIYDSTTGAILARVLDRKYGRDFGDLQMDVSMYNSTEAVRIFKEWARILRDRLDEIHGRKSTP